MIQLDNICAALGQGTQLQKQIFKDLSLNVPTGEFVMIVGSNGAGKSTLFNILTGTLPLNSGAIKIGGTEITRWPTHKRAPLIAKVMQDPRLATLDHMTIEENLSFAYLRGQTRGLLPHRRSKRIAFFREKLSLLNMGLENRLEETTAHLSGGQRQALSLIMAILCPSEVLLLDEITAALDTKTAERIMELTSHIVSQEKRTTLMITHNMHHALHYGDRTVILSGGRISQEYSAKEREKLTPTLLSELIESHV